MQIIPAILETTFESIEERILSVKDFVNTVHIDVMDKTLTKELTWNEPERLVDIPADLEIGVHLMVENPENIAPKWALDCVSLMIIHQEICEKNTCPPLLETVQMIKDYGKKVGIALNPSTSPEVLKPIIEDVDMVLVMTVEIGKSGQGMLEKPLEKIAQIKEMKPGIRVGVDGGVNSENIKEVKEAGADFAGVNSGIFKAKNIPEEIEKLKELAR